MKLGFFFITPTHPPPPCPSPVSHLSSTILKQYIQKQSAQLSIMRRMIGNEKMKDRFQLLIGRHFENTRLAKNYFHIDKGGGVRGPELYILNSSPESCQPGCYTNTLFNTKFILIYVFSRTIFSLQIGCLFFILSIHQSNFLLPTFILKYHYCVTIIKGIHTYKHECQYKSKY